MWWGVERCDQGGSVSDSASAIQSEGVGYVKKQYQMEWLKLEAEK